MHTTHRGYLWVAGMLLLPVLAANGQSGPAAAFAMGYYDPALQRVVLLGRSDPPPPTGRDRVWSWSGRRWEVISDSGPPSRTNASVAYDADRGVAVVSGGARQSATPPAWESIADSWEGTAGNWRRVSGTDIDPVDHQSMVYHAARKSLLLFGGIPGNRSEIWPSDTWELQPGGWKRIATTGPAGRGRTALAYDSKRQQVVLFGGVGASPTPGAAQPFYNDTWVWERDSWRKAADGGPPARYAHGMVFDERAGVVLLYSGSAAHRNAPLTDMWQWDGERWTEIKLTGATPGHRYQPVMVYDRARGKTVLYGGVSGSKDDTWEWDGRQWREILP